MLEFKETGVTEGAEAQFNSVIDVLEENGLVEAVKANVIGFGGDGAAVNMGE